MIPSLNSSRPREQTEMLIHGYRVHLLIPSAIAICDTLSVFAYILHVDPTYAHLLSIAMKGIFVLIVQPEKTIIDFSILSIFAIFAALVVSIIFSDSISFYPLTQACGFIASLSLTLCIIKVCNLRMYVLTIAWILTSSCALHIFLAKTGRLDVLWNVRVTYFGGTTPNLGAEIAAICALCISLTFKRPWLGLLLCAYSSWLLQGRSALIVIFLLATTRSFSYLWRTFVDRRRRLQIMILFPATVFFGGILLQYLIESMMLTNKYRGIGTGLVGRTDRWSAGVDTFLNNPITGIGYRQHELDALPSPHNFFLYALSELGLLSFIIFAIIARLMLRAMRENFEFALHLMPFLVMLMLNDRFLNLNPYPFLLIVLLFAAAAPTRQET